MGAILLKKGCAEAFIDQVKTDNMLRQIRPGAGLDVDRLHFIGGYRSRRLSNYRKQNSLTN